MARRVLTALLVVANASTSESRSERNFMIGNSLFVLLHHIGRVAYLKNCCNKGCGLGITNPLPCSALFS